MLKWNQKSAAETRSILRLKAVKKYEPPPVEPVKPGKKPLPSRPRRGQHQYYSEKLINIKNGKEYFVNYKTDADRRRTLNKLIIKLNSSDYALGTTLDDFEPGYDMAGNLTPIETHTYIAHEFIAKDADQELIFGPGGRRPRN